MKVVYKVDLMISPDPLIHACTHLRAVVDITLWLIRRDAGTMLVPFLPESAKILSSPENTHMSPEAFVAARVRFPVCVHVRYQALLTIIKQNLPNIASFSRGVAIFFV